MEKLKQGLTRNKQKAEKNNNQYPFEERGIRSPPVRTNDLNNGLVKVEMFMPGLLPGKDKFTPKGGSANVTFFNKGNGFEMDCQFRDETNKKTVVYKFKVRQLPGRVNIDESKWEVEKGKIVIFMEKHSDMKDTNWAKAVFERGLDQASSSSSSSDDD